MKKLVVVAAIVQAGQLLIAQRLPGGAFGGLWELPGGKVEPGETPTVAIVREIQEELGIRVGVEELLVQLEHPYPTWTVILAVYRVRVLEGTPQPLASQQIRWIDPVHWRDYPFPPATEVVLDRISPLLGA